MRKPAKLLLGLALACLGGSVAFGQQPEQRGARPVDMMRSLEAIQDQVASAIR